MPPSNVCDVHPCSKIISLHVFAIFGRTKSDCQCICPSGADIPPVPGSQCSTAIDGDTPEPLAPNALGAAGRHAPASGAVGGWLTARGAGGPGGVPAGAAPAAIASPSRGQKSSARYQPDHPAEGPATADWGPMDTGPARAASPPAAHTLFRCCRFRLWERAFRFGHAGIIPRAAHGYLRVMRQLAIHVVRGVGLAHVGGRKAGSGGAATCGTASRLSPSGVEAGEVSRPWPRLIGGLSLRVEEGLAVVDQAAGVVDDGRGVVRQLARRIQHGL